MKKEAVKIAVMNLPDPLNQGNSAFLQARKKSTNNKREIVSTVLCTITYKLFFNSYKMALLEQKPTK